MSTEFIFLFQLFEDAYEIHLIENDLKITVSHEVIEVNCQLGYNCVQKYASFVQKNFTETNELNVSIKNEKNYLEVLRKLSGLKVVCLSCLLLICNYRLVRLEES